MVARSESVTKEHPAPASPATKTSKHEGGKVTGSKWSLKNKPGSFSDPGIDGEWLA